MMGTNNTKQVKFGARAMLWVGSALLLPASIGFAEVGAGEAVLAEAHDPVLEVKSAGVASALESRRATAHKRSEITEQDAATYRWRTGRPVSEKMFATEQAGCFNVETITAYESCMRLHGYRLVGR